MKKRLLLVTMMSVFALQMTACAAETAPVETAPAETTEAAETTETTENVEIANPWRDITADEAFQLVTNSFNAPEGATNVKWSACGETNVDELPGALVQMTFDLDGMSFTAREQVVGDDNSDISGMYYDWTVTDDVTLANWAGGAMTGKTYRYVGDTESADLISWYDVEIGIAYSLSTVAKDLDGFDIQAVAEALYDEANQAGADIPDDIEEEHVPMDITGCETFTQIVDKLQAGQGYANTTIGDQDVLLVTSYTYDYDGDGKRFAAIDADIYQYDADGKILYQGYVTAGGTAYPLATDGKLLYVGSNHWMKKMIITEFNILAVDEQAYVEYDTNGGATYYHTSELRDVNDNFEGTVEDDSVLNQFFDDYNKAEIIEFNNVQ